MSLAEVIARHASDLMARPGVIGVGEGQSGGKPCVLVFVSPASGQQAGLPQFIEGYPVIVESTGPFRAEGPR